MRRILQLCCIAAVFAASSVQAKFDPAFVWTTLETPHFLIHYHQEGGETARRAAVIAEDIHARLVPRIQWEPRGKTHLILVDAMDEANGVSLPIPYNQMIVFLTRPAGEQGLGIASVDDWLRVVITHEYTHILQLDMVNGGPEKLQRVLGRIYFPNMFQPVWMIEGLATYEETEQTSGGRGRSPGAEMVLRMAVLEDAFPELGQASVFPDSWPGGQVPYLFGEGFTRFLADKYGREKLAEVSTAYSGRGFPFLVGSTGRRVLDGAEYADLWFEWHVELRERFGRQERQIRERGLTASEQKTRRGFVNLGPAFSPDGQLIAYAAAQADEDPGVRVMNADGTGDRRAVNNVFPASASGTGVSWHPDGSRLYYTKIEIRRSTNFYADIYGFDRKRGKEFRLTRGLRARDPHVSPDGKRLIFVANKLGTTRLALLDLSPGRAASSEADVTFLTPPGAEQYESPRFSPDGTKIAVSLWQPGGDKDIVVMDLQGATLLRLSRDRALDGGPCWSPDGRLIYFSSDRSGVFNIYAYELETGSLRQVTNVLGGAFSPAVSPDGRTLAFSSYSAKGFDIHTMALDPPSWPAAEPFIDRYPAVRYEEKAVETSERPYSPLPTILPRFWLPWAGYSRESGWLGGALTFGQDAVQRHSYFATALYGPKHRRTWYSLDYLYDGFLPSLRLLASDTDVTYSDLLEDSLTVADYTEKRRTFGGDIIFNPLRMTTQHFLTVGYRWREAFRLTDLPPRPGYAGVIPAEGVFASGRLGYLYNSSRRYAFSISPERGRTVAAGYERFDRALGGDFEFNKYTADWHEYLNLPPRHHVLLVRAFAGSSTGERIPQGAFQLGGDNPGDITLALDDQTVTLRGYPANLLRGGKAALGSLEYRFPVINLERGWDTAPLFFRRMHGALFAEAGNAWDGTLHHEDIRRSVGGEARFDIQVAYYLAVTFRFVVARGLDEGGETVSYFALWAPLEL